MTWNIRRMLALRPIHSLTLFQASHLCSLSAWNIVEVIVAELCLCHWLNAMKRPPIGDPRAIRSAICSDGCEIRRYSG